MVGSLLGIYLARRNYEVSIYEGRPDARRTDLAGGRSINLALSDRGLWALREVGLDQKVLDTMAIPMHKRIMHSREGKLSEQPYGQHGEAINSVSRSGLNALLMDEAERQGVKMYFEQRCLDVDWEKTEFHFQNPVSGTSQKVPSDVAFGADGAFSAVRTRLQKTDRFNYSQHFIEHGYKELTIPANTDGGFQMDPNALHIWPRGRYMLIALPNPDGSFTCTLFFPFEGEYSFASLQNTAQARTFFEGEFSDALDLMPYFDQEWKQNPDASMVIIRCYPWSRRRTALIGDASHAIVPFYGQGMNSGFEDCRVLNETLEKNQGDWDSTLQEYEQLRKPDADAIADLAMRNFVEMRDLTGDPAFLLQKKIEGRFAQRHPDLWTPLYTLVTFSPEVRYSEALARGQRQDRIMEKIMALPNIHQRWDSDEVEEEMLRLVREGNASQAEET